MISLDQIRLLEQKVDGILQLVSKLEAEKSALENENTDLKAQLEKTAAKCRQFEQDEAKIEQGIVSVLNRLNDMEDAVQHVLEQDVRNETASAANENNAESSFGSLTDNQPADRSGLFGQAASVSEKNVHEPALKPVGEQLDIF